MPSPTAISFANISPAPQWGALLGLSVAFAAILSLAGLPAALFLGAMAGGVVMGVNGATVRIPRPAYIAAQGVMGAFIATALTPAIFQKFAAEWPIFLAIVLSIIAASSVQGWVMSRWRVMPGTTSVWGTWPGGASAMVIMAAEFGADARLVAFMQYFRVVCVASLASLVSAFFVHRVGSSGLPMGVAAAAFNWKGFSETILLIVSGVLAGGYLLRIPSGPMLLTLAAGAVLHISGAIQIELPRGLLMLTYAIIGWHVGLSFTPAILLHALRALPKILLSVSILIAIAGMLAYILTQTLGIDALTAYLATSPGGMDSVAIIAASSNVDAPFVMALQTFRFLIIVMIGPPLARLVARHMKASGRYEDEASR